MKYQFFIKDLRQFKQLDDIYELCIDGQVEEIVCTSGILSDVVEDIQRDKIIAIVDYPYGNSSRFARDADINYCLDMGISKIEIPLNSDTMINGDWEFLSDEFNDSYDICSASKAVLKPLIDYRLLSKVDKQDKQDYIINLLHFMQKKIGMDSITINSGQISDYFPENIDMCKYLSENNISVTTFRDIHDVKQIPTLEKYAYRVRMSSTQSLRLITN